MTEQHANPEDFDLYALDALDGEDRSRFEAHLRACSTCREELNGARSRVTLLALSAVPIEPPSSVKSALLASVRLQSGSGNTAPNTANRVRRKSPALRFAFLFAVTTALLAIATVWLWRNDQKQSRNLDSLQMQLNEAQAQASRNAAADQIVAEIFGAPDTIQVAMLQQPGGPPGQAHVFYNARIGLLLYAGEVAPAPANKSYQLWLVPSSGAPVSAGLISGLQQGAPTVVHLQAGLAAKAFAVTVEPSGGEAQPTGPKILVGPVS